MFERIVDQKVRRRFEAKFRVTPGCWLWTAALGHAGYAKFGFNGKNAIAARISYRLYVGDIADGMCILHSCDNPQCVNPDHLRQGTHTDNTSDKMIRGRHRGRHILTESQVLEIRRDQRTPSVIAVAYGISPQNVCSIQSGRSWKSLGLPPERKSARKTISTRSRWTDVQVDALRKRYPNESVAKIALDMGRTRAQLSQKAYELGIRQRPARKAIAKATGVRPC